MKEMVSVMEREEIKNWIERENESSLEMERQLMGMTYYVDALTDEDAYWDGLGMHIEG